MQWIDRGIILGTRKIGETGVLVEVFTQKHGRSKAMVYGGTSKSKVALLQGGNSVHVNWRARLDEQLGYYQIEPITMRSADLVAAPQMLYGFMSLAALLRYLPERDPHETLFDIIEAALEHLGERIISALLFLRLELSFLSEIGFGLDLSACAVTGKQENLIYISPRTGRAVSAEAGEPYKERLLSLPPFLLNPHMLQDDFSLSVPPEDIRVGFSVTEHFLRRSVFESRGYECPRERERFIALALQSC